MRKALLAELLGVILPIVVLRLLGIALTPENEGILIAIEILGMSAIIKMLEIPGIRESILGAMRGFSAAVSLKERATGAGLIAVAYVGVYLFIQIPYTPLYPGDEASGLIQLIGLLFLILIGLAGFNLLLGISSPKEDQQIRSARD